jgi:very-short-patch-repair endonuclease
MRADPKRLRVNSTDAERRLWAVLRNRRLLGYKFRRQHPIGRFVVDFACTRHRLVIEADGGQHADNEADERRTAWLESQGWRVIRFWNPDILRNAEGVVTMILQALEENSPHPPRVARHPLPQCGRGKGPAAQPREG